MMMILWLFFGFAMYSIFSRSRHSNSQFHNEKSPEDILKERYINGEIDEEVYKKMNKIINR